MDIKELPNSEEMEKALLGALIIDDKLVTQFFNEGEVEWFYSPNHKTIAKTIYKLALEGGAIDLVTLKDSLSTDGKLDVIGGIQYLVELTEDANSFNWSTYSETLSELYKRREMVKQGDKVMRSAQNSDTFEDDIEKHLQSFSSILSGGKSLSTSSEENIDKLKKLIEENRGKDMLGWSWGIPWLDEKTKGIRKSKTYRIGSPSGVGKSNLVYQITDSLLKQGAKVLFVSLENSIETTYVKLLSTVQGVNPNSIERGMVEPDFAYLDKYAHSFKLTDQTFDLGEIKREVLRVKPDVVILDYIGLVNIKGHDEKTLYQKYADEVKQFLQKNQEIAWVDLSNLNKDDDEEKIRMYKGFNGAAKLRNNTDFALHMFYHKPFYEYKKTVWENGTDDAKRAFEGKQAITFLISKNRLGVDGVEETFVIDFNEGIKYKQSTDAQKEKWQALGF